MDLFEAMDTCRAIRYFKPDPVPGDLIAKVLWAATRAPSPGNSQAWEFIVVDERPKLDAISAAIRVILPAIEAMPTPDKTTRLMLEGAKNIAGLLGGAPALILVCGRNVYPPGRPDEAMVYSACFPAAQNILLAARAVGLGTTFTTMHRVAHTEIRSILSIPEDVRMAAMIPIGWPAVSFGPVKRRPVEDVVHRNGW